MPAFVGSIPFIATVHSRPQAVPRAPQRWANTAACRHDEALGGQPAARAVLALRGLVYSRHRDFQAEVVSEVEALGELKVTSFGDVRKSQGPCASHLPR